jgi:hypothetical protein
VTTSFAWRHGFLPQKLISHNCQRGKNMKADFQNHHSEVSTRPSILQVSTIGFFDAQTLIFPLASTDVRPLTHTRRIWL